MPLFIAPVALLSFSAHRVFQTHKEQLLRLGAHLRTFKPPPVINTIALVSAEKYKVNERAVAFVIRLLQSFLLGLSLWVPKRFLFIPGLIVNTQIISVRFFSRRLVRATIISDRFVPVPTRMVVIELFGGVGIRMNVSSQWYVVCLYVMRCN